MACACLKHIAGDRFIPYACGEPGETAREVDPVALATLRRASMRAPVPQPAAWDTFRRMDSPRMDFVILLDAGVAQRQPSWPDQPETAVWTLPDALDGAPPPGELAERTMVMLHGLRRRLELLAHLPLQGASPADIRHDLRDIAYIG
ncbi:MAG TPA: protein tyrosine phosphatase [Ramlibacter sp.]|uniref:protein tyrosine phosphatase n=1 Tax=Ramlibacter sp. TaxID=1917967 RepID=UPI002CD8DEFB|nr:protein tyrosine phosphatase [Ramlibacter sp.]HVZ44034.1 protein tyrosine phosphatase [Ramlibacter sp.]